MSVTAPTPEAGDLTARARVRNAALALFAEHGVAQTSIRAIAAQAGVSSGLVQHHFGTKEALRSACDDYVLAQLVAMKEDLVVLGGVFDPASLAAAHPEILRLYRYLARSMVDGSPAAAEMFGQMVAATEAWLHAHHPGLVEDEHGYAVVLVAAETGMLALQQQVSAALGADVLSADGHLRLSRAKVEFYAKPLLDADVARQALRSIDTLLVLRPRPRRPDHEGGRP